MTLVVNRPKCYSFIKNSEQCSLFLIWQSKLVALLLVALSLMACNPSEPSQHRTTLSGPIMGTDYRITVLLDNTQVYEDLEPQLIQVMESVNQSMSTYLSNSELSLLNQLPESVPVDLSASLLDVLNESLMISELSDGAFDVTVGKAVSLWGFGPDGAIKKTPTEQEVELLKGSVGYQNLTLNGKSLTKTKPNMYIDLSAIAKGYAVDQVANKLESFGIINYLVDIGGELRASGYSANNQQWRIGIEKPHDLGGIQQIISLSGKSIATSGDYRNYHIIDGQQFSHTIDSKTLKPVFHRLALVSVVSDKASTADALATAIMAMGESRGLTFAKDNELAVYMVIRESEKDQYSIEMTDEFVNYLQ